MTESVRVIVAGDLRSNHVRTRALALRDAGLKVTIASDYAPTALSEPLSGVEIVRTRVTAAGGIWSRLKQIVRRIRILRDLPGDVVYVHFAAGPLARAALFAGKPLAVNLMGSDLAPETARQRGPVSRFLTRRLLQRAALVTAKSPALAREAIAAGAAKDRVHVVLWGIVLDRFDQQRTPLRAGGKLPQGRLILCPRMLRPRYLQDVVVRSMPEVLRVVPDARLVLTDYNGRSSYRSELQELIRETGVADAVDIVEGIEASEMAGWYRRADVTISLCRHEGFPQTVLESMAAGTPTIAARIPELDELLKHERDALLTELQPAAVADALIRVLTDSELADTLVRHGRQFVGERADLRREACRVAEWLGDLSGIRPVPVQAAASEFGDSEVRQQVECVSPVSGRSV